MKEKWIEELRQKMADYEEPAPEMSWDEIEKAVHTQQNAKVVPLWLRKVAVAAILLTIAVVGYKALENDAPIPEKLTEADVPQQTAPPRQAQTPPQDIPTEHPLLAKVSKTIRQAFLPEPITEAKVVPTKEPEAAVEDVAIESAPSPSEPEQVQETRTEQIHTGTYYPQAPIYPSDLPGSASSKNRLTAKLYLSNAMGNSEHFSTWNYFVEVNNNPEGPQGVNISSPGSNNGEQGGDDSNIHVDNPNNTTIKTLTATQQSHHYQPIRYGLSLRYSLNERWAVETGLTYALLTSDITTTDADKTTLSKQRLNYIGIPLKAEYLLLRSRYFNAYISAGTLVEKMVKGHQETIGTGTDESISIRPLQFSVNGAVGAEFNLSRQFSIYAEPGIGYYFDNGSSVHSFYQDKPLSFNLNVGLRFSFK